MDLKKALSGLKEKDGIYYSNRAADISYPEAGNRTCFELEDQSFWFRHRNSCIISAVKRFCAPGAVIFDIGGGNGFTTKALQDEGFESVLVEPGAEGAANARKRGVKNVICAALQDLDPGGQAIPAAGLFDVLEHVEDAARFLKTVCGRMEKGGYIFITVPAHMSLWSYEDALAGHFRRYGIKQIGRELEEAGFTAVYSTYFFGFLVLPILLFKAIPGKLGLHRKKYTLNERKREHASAGFFRKSLIGCFTETEIKTISGKGRNAFGSSLMIAAKKAAK